MQKESKEGLGRTKHLLFEQTLGTGNLLVNATIQPEVVLYYYDGPLAFLAHQHLYYFVEDGDGVTWYLVTPCATSEPDLSCVRSFFEGRPTFFVAIDHNSKVVRLEEHKFPLNLVLPELGIGLPS